MKVNRGGRWGNHHPIMTIESERERERESDREIPHGEVPPDELTEEQLAEREQSHQAGLEEYGTHSWPTVLEAAKAFRDGEPAKAITTVVVRRPFEVDVHAMVGIEPDSVRAIETDGRNPIPRGSSLVGRVLPTASFLSPFGEEWDDGEMPIIADFMMGERRPVPVVRGDFFGCSESVCMAVYTSTVYDTPIPGERQHG